ncbi:MAG: phage tail tape measure protein [Rhizobiales bacterium]|nr:phage tail tape measure protein [Hyphomicrobiales bacterium]
MRADATEVRAELGNLEGLASDFGRSMTNALRSAATSGRSFKSVLQSLGQSLSSLALNAALKPLQDSLSSGIGSLFRGILPFAKGGVVGASMPTPFARGGIVASPTLFPMGNRGTGLAGEAGPEAILPLSRGSDGRLGVRTSGQGGAINISFNVTATDAESFRRSETQVAAMVHRAVARGQRNL